MSDGHRASNQARSGAKSFGGPYSAAQINGENVLLYNGNRSTASPVDLLTHSFEVAMREDRIDRLGSDPSFKHLHEIDNAIFFSTVDFFRARRAQWCNLPLTTLMISSPGEVYAGQTLNYTTDTLPIDIRWFDHPGRVFLSESSQFYLELRLLIDGINEVFCIYNSFRKENADLSHLAEFQHIEFEGHVDFYENLKIAEDLVRTVVTSVAATARNHLMHFLDDRDVDSLLASVAKDQFETMTLKEALRILQNDTCDDRYREFSLKYFGAWEEVKLTQLVGRHVWVTEFPLLQIPFYHNSKKDVDGIPVAENADLIVHGYREVVGSGVRITSPSLLSEKARIFNLPTADYEPYLKTRGLPQYQSSAGFGLGWQRLTHWMLKLPAIWDAVHVPRGHLAPRP